VAAARDGVERPKICTCGNHWAMHRGPTQCNHVM